MESNDDVANAPHEEKETACRAGEEKTVAEDGQEGYASGDGLLPLRPISTRNEDGSRIQQTATESKSAENSPSMSRRRSRLPSTAAGSTTATAPDHHGSNPADSLQQPPFPARRRLRIYPAGNRTNKWVTRELAALDFLTGIRMRNEAAIRARGANGNRGGVSTEDADFSSSGGRASDNNRLNWPQQHDGGGAEAFPEGLAPNAGAGGALNSSDRASGNTAAVPQGDDSDSDGGWLDQPLPSASGVDSGGGGGGGHSSALLRGTPGRGGPGAGVAGTSGRISSMGSPAPARRLRGREAAHVRVPASFRHCMQSLPGHSAAVVRQWEQRLTQQERLLEGRMFFSCSKGYPVMVSSVIHYKPQEEQARRVRQKWIDERGAEAFLIPKRDWRGYSYAHLLRPLHVGASGALASSGEPGGDGSGGGGGHIEHSDGEGGAGGGSGTVGGEGGAGRGVEGGEAPYKAGFLDDPALKLGKHRHMTRGDQNTGPVVCSVLLFVKPRVLKDELNARFREEHPSLPPSLTLSKIRSVKRQALLGCHRAKIEVSTVALACVYFERLCLAGVVTKPNRRLAMAACLAIAYKFNEPVLMEGANKLPALWAFVDQEWQVSKKRVLEAEFGVLVQLSFNLHEDPRDIFYHFVLLLKMIESNAVLYLGEEMMGLHQKALESFRDIGNDDGGGTASGSGDAGAESPNSRNLSEGGTIVGDTRPRAINAFSSQSSASMQTPGWLQRRPNSGSRWLVGWRGAPANDVGLAAAPGTAQRPSSLTDRQASTTVSDRIAKLKEAGQGLGKETRQRSQKLNRHVREGVSYLTHGVSSRRRGRRRMES